MTKECKCGCVVRIVDDETTIGDPYAEAETCPKCGSDEDWLEG